MIRLVDRTHAFLAFMLLLASILAALPAHAESWTAGEIEDLAGLALAALGPVPADPTNRVADDRRSSRAGAHPIAGPGAPGGG